MLRELISILRSTDPLRAMGENFAKMIQLAYEMNLAAGKMYFGEKDSPVDRTRIYEQDVEVNQLQRDIRKQVVAHLSFKGNVTNMPYCLLLMSLVKDVERLGDYAKNLIELAEIQPGLRDDEIKQELLEIRRGVEEAFQSTADVFASSDRERAIQLIRQGRDIAHRCDALILRIAGGKCEARTTTAQVLGTRYYKRIGGHVLNVLSSVVMPLHKIDYYDEDEVPTQEKDSESE